LNIVFNTFFIERIGGIETYKNELALGLSELGHKVTMFDISLSKNPKDPKKLSFRTEEQFKKYLDLMKESDVVIFTHPCPHLNTSFSDTSWYRCYNELKQTKVAIFHETLAQRYYPWIKNVKIDKYIAVQSKAVISIKYTNAKDYLISNHPLDLIDIDLWKKDVKNLQFIAPHQWKIWKRMHLLIKSIPLLNNVKVNSFYNNRGGEFYRMRMASYYDTDIYNNGKMTHSQKILLEYINCKNEKDKKMMEKIHGIVESYLKYKDILKKAIDSKNLLIHDYVPRSDLINFFKNSLGIIDLSTYEGYGKKLPSLTSINYSVLEGMKYACVPIVCNTSIQEPFTKDNFVVIPEGNIPQDLAKVLNTFDYSKYETLIKVNQQILRQHYDRKIVAKNIMDYIEGKIEGKKINTRTLLSIYD